MNAINRKKAGAFARAVRQGYLQLFGIPDYERYLAHHAAHHPGEPVLSRRAFAAHAIERRYQRKGARCC
ncbi:MAG: YbdD/YjiX family protein [Betaproteobacteria bacterium]